MFTEHLDEIKSQVTIMISKPHLDKVEFCMNSNPVSVGVNADKLAMSRCQPIFARLKHVMP